MCSRLDRGPSYTSLLGKCGESKGCTFCVQPQQKEGQLHPLDPPLGLHTVVKVETGVTPPYEPSLLIHKMYIAEMLTKLANMF